MYERSYIPQQVRRTQPLGRRKRRLWPFLIGLVVVTVGIFHLMSHQVQAIDMHPELAKELSAVLKTHPDISVGVALIDLDDNMSFTYGQKTPFVAASTTKVLTAADFLSRVEQGRYSLNMPLGVSTAAWQLQEMVNQSDNDSWHLFTDLLGRAQLQNYARKLGLASYNDSDNTITALDEAKLLQQLYQEKLLNKAHTSLLLSYMQHTNDESLIPAALPAGAVVYHKYGELVDTDDDSEGNFVHDAAIISWHGQAYVLTIYTNNASELNITARQELIHRITQDVVDAES